MSFGVPSQFSVDTESLKFAFSPRRLSRGEQELAGIRASRLQEMRQRGFRDQQLSQYEAERSPIGGQPTNQLHIRQPRLCRL